ncbi:M15 family metallopeptidase [Actinoplanes philippinensis]|uniref:M15 family metallopeptidase n=1 Tax=Actinoplanes philippinensis TaxID=35752 RepID=UPI0033D8B834
MRRSLCAIVCALLLAPATPADAAPPAAAYVIRPGDTLTSISRRYDVRVTDLRKWNSLPRGEPLRVDGLLRLTAPEDPLPEWSTRVLTVTAAEANGDPAKECPVPAADLRKIWVRYLGFDGIAHDGYVIMHQSLAAGIQRAFGRLYRWRFPIMAMQPMVVEDKTVLTLGYECRFVAGTTRWSQHSYGLAIDINPRQNPMIRGDYLDPPNSRTWLAREHYWPGMMHEDGAVPAFTAEGFYWGGKWKTLLDYMHFSTNDR